MTGQSVANGVWITGAMTGTSWKILAMTNLGNNIYSYTTQLAPGDSGAYYFMNDDVWGSRESVPVACRKWWNSDRGYKMEYKDTVFAYKWATCSGIATAMGYLKNRENNPVTVFPNPSSGSINITINKPNDLDNIELVDITGKIVKQIDDNSGFNSKNVILNGLNKGLYVLRFKFSNKTITQKIQVL
jgi:hypothetical protein